MQHVSKDAEVFESQLLQGIGQQDQIVEWVEKTLDYLVSQSLQIKSDVQLSLFVKQLVKHIQ